MNEPLVLDTAFQEILHDLETTSDHYFITGKAGTGKSTLLKLFRKTTHKKIVVLSPTGISALNVQGQTIHSFFQFAPKLLVPHELFVHRRLVNLLKAIDVVIIDEISMVRADVMDAIDFSLRLHRKNNEPFGGVQMIFFGDLYQLPPVVASNEEKQYFRSIYPAPYFFSAHVFSKGLDVHMIELTKVYRQNEKNFIRLLDNLRTMQCDEEDLMALNERYISEAVIEEPYLTLCAINATAQQINMNRLNEIDEPALLFLADVRGEFSEKQYPADYALQLKKHAQVMFLKNDPEKKFVNGTLGVITSLTQEQVVVRIQKEDGKSEEIDVPRMSWENLRYKLSPESEGTISSEVIGSFTQYPLKLAWAVTIHKSQGKTYDRVAIDMGRGAFEHGQTYVALSRCRKLEGIYLKKPLTFNDIMVDETIVEFYDRHR